MSKGEAALFQVFVLTLLGLVVASPIHLLDFANTADKRSKVFSSGQHHSRAVPVPLHSGSDADPMRSPPSFKRLNPIKALPADASCAATH